jgi:hypothetical protein
MESVKALPFISAALTQVNTALARFVANFYMKTHYRNTAGTEKEKRAKVKGKPAWHQPGLHLSARFSASSPSLLPLLALCLRCLCGEFPVSADFCPSRIML